MNDATTQKRAKRATWALTLAAFLGLLQGMGTYLPGLESMLPPKILGGLSLLSLLAGLALQVLRSTGLAAADSDETSAAPDKVPPLFAGDKGDASA